MAKKGLGKGLDALFDSGSEKVFETVEAKAEIQSDAVVMLKISKVEPNKEQPRKSFDEEKLKVLSESIKNHGVIQPIIVRETKNNYYQIIAGERRWRASRLAGLKEIPAIIRSYDELKTAEVALIENLQREDLNPIEEAMGYKTLIDDYSLTQENISTSVGKSRSSIANSLRLLSLQDEIQQFVIEGKLSSGHARAVLSVEADKQLELANFIIKNDLSVRQAENAAKNLNTPQKQEKKETKNLAFELQLKEIQSRLSSQLGTKVKISNGEKKGKIEIEYYGLDDFERLLRILKM